jgi:hypothetical protein
MSPLSAFGVYFKTEQRIGGGGRICVGNITLCF